MPFMMNGDGDLGRHLTIGRHILATRQIPDADLYSHTLTGAVLVPHEWLSQLLFALAHQAAGLNGVAWLTAGILATSYTLLTGAMRRLGVRAPVALLGGVAASMVGSLHALTRPHIFTLLFFTFFLVLLEGYRRTGRARPLWLLLPAMVLWANLHGAFITGFVLVALYTVGQLLDRQRPQAARLAALLAALILVSWLNPVGPRLISHSFSYLDERFLVNATVEYKSPDFHIASTWPFAALLLASLGLGWRSPRRLAWTPLLLLGVWSAFGLYASRNIPLYAQVATLLLAGEVDSWIEETAPALARALAQFDAVDRLAWGWMWTGALVALLVGLEATGRPLDVLRQGNRFDPAVFPVRAVDVLAASPPEGEMLNEFAWGGYLLYRLWPEKRVFIDGQTDFYGEALTVEHVKIVAGAPDWEEHLAHHDVRWIILPPDRPLAAWLDRSPDWQPLYRDDTAAVWVRDSEASVAGDSN